MSVMTRNPDGSLASPGTINGRQGNLTIAPVDYGRQAVIDQLAPSTASAAPRGTVPTPSAAAPTTGGASPFARGGRVTQLPGANKAGKLAETGASVGTTIGANLASRGVDAAANAGNLAAGAGIGLGTSYLANKLKVKEDMPTFGGEFGKYTDDFGRRFEGTGGGVASNAVKYAGYGANPALVAATGGLSVAAGALGGAIKGAVSNNAPSAFSDFSVENAADAIKAQYRDELGREANDDEVMAHLVNQGWDPNGGDRWVGEKNLFDVMRSIRGSDEAQAFARTGRPGGADATRAAVIDQLGADGGPAAAAAAGRGTTPSNAERTGGLEDGGAGFGGVGTPMRLASASGPGVDGGAGFRAPGGTLTDTSTGASVSAGGGAAPDPSGWNTDGYAAPQYVPQGDYGPAPPGFDQAKWSDPNHQTPKYAVSRILAQHGGTPEGVAAAMPELERAYPGATFNGKDKVTIPGVGTIDVVKAAGLGGQGLQWIPEGEGGGGGDVASASAPTAARRSVLDDDGGDLLARLQAEIERIQSGTPDRKQLIAGLGAANG